MSVHVSTSPRTRRCAGVARVPVPRAPRFEERLKREQPYGHLAPLAPMEMQNVQRPRAAVAALAAVAAAEVAACRRRAHKHVEALPPGTAVALSAQQRARGQRAATLQPHAVQAGGEGLDDDAAAGVLPSDHGCDAAGRRARTLLVGQLAHACASAVGPWTVQPSAAVQLELPAFKLSTLPAPTQNLVDVWNSAFARNEMGGSGGAVTLVRMSSTP